MSRWLPSRLWLPCAARPHSRGGPFPFGRLIHRPSGSPTNASRWAVSRCGESNRDQPRRPARHPRSAGLRSRSDPAIFDRAGACDLRRGPGRRRELRCRCGFPRTVRLPRARTRARLQCRHRGHPAILAQVYGGEPASTTRIVGFHIRRSAGTFGTVLTASVPESLDQWGHLTPPVWLRPGGDRGGGLVQALGEAEGLEQVRHEGGEEVVDSGQSGRAGAGVRFQDGHRPGMPGS
jgi:hypothetical protein